MSALTIKVGSKNKAKVAAVEEILQDYPHLKDYVVEGVEVLTEVPEQPIGLEEITRGATARARNAFEDCSYSIGIESGLALIPGTKSGYMDVCIAAVYDGKDSYLGLSSGFEPPDSEIIRLVIEDGLDFSAAANHVGLTRDPKIGRNEGVIGILTKGKVDRKEYTKQALRGALIHIDIHEPYGT